MIRFGTYNVRNGRNGGLELTLREMYHANMDLGIFQEKKLRTASTPAGRLGTSPSQRTCQAVEADQQFVPNVVSFQLATGARRWYIVGCYLAPDDTLTIESVVAALKERPRGSKLLVVGDFKAK